jgi:hypothetical protein
VVEVPDAADGSCDDAMLEAGRVLERTALLAAAHRLVPAEVTEPSRSRPGWRTVSEQRWVVA